MDLRSKPLQQFGLRELELGQNGFRAWCGPLDQPNSRLRQFKQTLSSDEQERADRYPIELGKNRFIVRRGLIRTIIGCNLGIEPAAVQFHHPPGGKPFIEHRSDKGKLLFSISHSDGLALYAIAWNREIGADLERVRLLDEAEVIAQRFFSTNEVEAIQKLPQGQRIQGFFNCWTRKEAYLKATGLGLSRPLNEIIVSLVPGEMARLVSVAGDQKEPSRWSLIDLTPAPGYVAAICVEFFDDHS